MHVYWFAFFILIVATSLCAEVVPSVNVPLSSKPVILDGIYNAEEWEDAALLRQISILGTTDPGEQQTKVFLKHSEGFIYAGIQCFENQKGYPTAYKRKSTEFLGDDDAVQIVLGTADEKRLTREVLMMGGYEGAMNTAVASADHYYQFTVNAAGASSRTYNEGVLERPLFDSVVSKGDGYWFVEMKIPFASAGIDHTKNQTIFFNFYRFRPPATIGWFARGFGSYVPMPFGTMKLTGQAERTVEDALQPVKREVVRATVRDSASMEFYPLAEKVIAVLTGFNTPGTTALLQVGGAGEKRVQPEAKRTQIEIQVPEGAPSSINARLTITSADGKTLHEESKAFENPAERPSWYGNDIAKDYLKSKVPSPWTKPEVSGSTVKLSNKEIGFGSNGLFESVSFTEDELLSGASELLLEVNGRAVQMKKGKFFANVRDNQARVQASSLFEGGSVDVRSVIDYDGFTVVKLRVNGVDPSAISSLSVRFAINSENAKFVYRDTAQTVRELTGFGWQGKAGPVWVGGHDRGLSFDFDTPVFLSQNQKSQVQVVEEDGTTWLQVNLVDAGGQVEEPSHIFRFILQPTPTKKPSLDKAGIYHKVALWFEEWSDYQGYPDLAKMEQVKERSEKAHAEGLLQTVYFSQMLASNAPGFTDYKNDLIAPPERDWYKRAYDPGKDVVCYVSCARGAFGDLLLDGIQKLSDQGDIDGIYMDGTSVPWECDNPSHLHCAGSPEIGWDTEDYTPYIGTRNFLKRLRGIFDAKNKPYFIMSHTGGAINIATMSLCDEHYEGEQLSRYRRGYRLPLSTFASGYCGRPWGFRTDLLPMRPIYSCEEMRTWGLLHDGAVGDGPWGEPGGQALEERIYGDFQDDALVEYYPYWHPQPHVKLDNTNILCSYYKKSDTAMVVLGNLSWEDQKAKIDLAGLFPGKTLYVTDVVDEVAVPIESNQLQLDLKMHRYAAFRVDLKPNTEVREAVAPVYLAPVEFPQTKLTAEDWELAEARSGVGIERDFTLEGMPDCIKLTSTAFMHEANVRLDKYPIGNNGHLRLKIQHDGIFKVTIGNSGFSYSGSWAGWATVNLDKWNRGTLYAPEVVHDRAVDLVVSITDGVLDATYDGLPLASGLELSGVDEQSVLSLATWAGHSLVLEPGEVSKQPLVLFEPTVKHPVL